MDVSMRLSFMYTEKSTSRDVDFSVYTKHNHIKLITIILTLKQDPVASAPSVPCPILLLQRLSPAVSTTGW